jgi:hypothetical protein
MDMSLVLLLTMALLAGAVILALSQAITVVVARRRIRK